MSTGHKRTGFTFVELIVLVFVMAAAIALILPPLLRRPPRSPRLNCVNNLKQIGLSFKVWAIDNGDRFPMQVSTNQGGTKELVSGPFAYAHFVVMSNELSTPRVLLCPADTRRVYATNFQSDLDNRKLSYFVGLTASVTNPASFLAGDRDITNGTPVVRGILTVYTNRATGWAGNLHRVDKDPVGNLGPSDGSVNQLTRQGLTSQTVGSGLINRLALP